jgi:hypothetical protein
MGDGDPEYGYLRTAPTSPPTAKILAVSGQFSVDSAENSEI